MSPAARSPRARRLALVALAASPACARAVGPGGDAGIDAPADGAPSPRRRDAGPASARCGPPGDGAALDVAPRLLSPLSTATVTSRRPTLRWELGQGTTAAQVEVCADRACASPLASWDAGGATSGRPPGDLPRGTAFWRVASGPLGRPTTACSATWEFSVGARETGVDTRWGSTLDVNGDGFADVAVSAWAFGGQGGVYVFLGGPSGPGPASVLTLRTPNAPSANFGVRVGSAGDLNGDGYGDLFVGAAGETDSPGAVFVYLGGADGVADPPDVALADPQGPNDVFGSSVAGVGDLNSDGFADLLVGVIRFATGDTEVYAYLGGPAGVPSAPSRSLPRPPQGFNSAVAAAGDVNGDGFSDVLLGGLPGGLSVYLGAAGGLNTTPAVTLQGFSSGSGGADFNGDGYADIAAGDATAQVVSVYLGGAGGVAPAPATTLRAPGGPGGEFGVSLAGEGDLNADGYTDLVVGADFTDSAGRHHDFGSAYVYPGGARGVASSATATLAGPAGQPTWGMFGRSLASAGDVNGDGYGDLIVGASQGLNGPSDAFFFFGSASGAQGALPLSDPDGPNGWFGTSVALRARPACRRSRASAGAGVTAWCRPCRRCPAPGRPA